MKPVYKLCCLRLIWPSLAPILYKGRIALGIACYREILLYKLFAETYSLINSTRGDLFIVGGQRRDIAPHPTNLYEYGGKQWLCLRIAMSLEVEASWLPSWRCCAVVGSANGWTCLLAEIVTFISPLGVPFNIATAGIFTTSDLIWSVSPKYNVRCA